MELGSRGSFFPLQSMGPETGKNIPLSLQLSVQYNQMKLIRRHWCHVAEGSWKNEIGAKLIGF